MFPCRKSGGVARANGPLVTKHMLVFDETLGSPVPPAGGVQPRWFSNSQAATGEIPKSLLGRCFHAQCTHSNKEVGKSASSFRTPGCSQGSVDSRCVPSNFRHSGGTAMELPRGDIRHQSWRPWRHLFFRAVSAARRAAHTGHKADGNTAGGVPSPGRRNAGIVPWTSVPCCTCSHSINTSGSRVLRLRRSTRSKASRRSIMLLKVLRRLDQSSIEFCPYFRCHSSRPSTGGSSTT
jgi:hypothetical protein